MRSPMPWPRSLCTTPSWTSAPGPPRSEGGGGRDPHRYSEDSASIPALGRGCNPHRHPPARGERAQSPAEPGRALPFPLAEQRVGEPRPRAGWASRWPGAAPCNPPPPRGSDTGTALPPWKLLSEVLLCLPTRGPCDGTALFVLPVPMAVVTSSVCVPCAGCVGAVVAVPGAARGGCKRLVLALPAPRGSPAAQGSATRGPAPVSCPTLSPVPPEPRR